MAKKTSKPKETKPAGPPPTLEDVLASAYIGLAGDLEGATGAERAKIGRAIVQLTDAKRKYEAAKRKETAGYTISSVLQWARGIDARDRAELVRDLLAIDSKRSGLA